ncbi:MAG: hypothetical protein LBE22_00470 [Azoarcus sp.]|jgi:hypothetical protein|nr:hypothetical protein [Azoarcus sp.]
MKIFAAAVAFLLVVGSAHAQSVSVRNLTPPGAFEVVNEGAQEVSLSSRVQVQRLFNGAWQNEITDMQLVLSNNPPACITLRGGEHLRPPPWNGHDCASQGLGSCRATWMLPPGTFRFLVASCSGDWSVAGPAFNMEGGSGKM